MCGVNGIFAYNRAAGLPSSRELAATREYMRARGPDGLGEWWSADGRLGLGHRRLAILDLSVRGNQPMTSDDGKLVVVFNGEIYNAPALRSELEASGRRFRTASDTEVLLHLFSRDGGDMVHALRGMFAFAIWDAERRRLFLARDTYGIKPLYTANDGWTFRFASQVRALLAGKMVSRDPEPAGTVGFYLFGSVPEPFTLYRDIRALPAGHTQWVDSLGPREPQPFADLAAILAEGARVRAPALELSERLRSATRESVRAHLLADVEVGLFLSAGVDSGAVLGVMRDSGQKEIRAITLAFDEFQGTVEDEVPLAAQIAAWYGAHHVVRRVGKEEFRTDLPAILEAMDQPSIDGLNTWFIAKAAKEAGLKVALSGLGGDELLAGYPSFTDVPCWRRRFGLLATIPGIGILAREVMRVLIPSYNRKHPKAIGFLEYAGSWPDAYLLRRGLFLPDELAQFMDPDFVREGLRRLKPLAHLGALLKPDPGSDTARIAALESAHYLRNQLLRDADWAGMAHSVEIRVPLVDVKLLTAIAPLMTSLQPGSGKAALAQAPMRPLPTEIISRPKTGFAVPTADWMNEESGVQIRTSGSLPIEKGLVSRRWSRRIMDEHIFRERACHGV